MDMNLLHKKNKSFTREDWKWSGENTTKGKTDVSCSLFHFDTEWFWYSHKFSLFLLVFFEYNFSFLFLPFASICRQNDGRMQRRMNKKYPLWFLIRSIVVCLFLTFISTTDYFNFHTLLLSLSLFFYLGLF
jgi:hypothetical protein